MPTYVAQAADDWINSNRSAASPFGESQQNTAYTSARAGFNLAVSPEGDDTELYVGQMREGNSYAVREAFLSFDTSGIPDDATVTGVALKTTGGTHGPAVTDIFEARLFDWSTSVTTADWVAGANLGNHTLVATFDSANWSSGVESTWVENGTAFRTGINKTGVTRLILSQENHRLGTRPTGVERMLIEGADGPTPPQLVVTYETALIVQDATHGHGADSPSLTQTHELAVADSSHGHEAGSATLAVTHQLEVDDSTHGHVAENVVLEAASVSDLEVQDVSHAHTVETPSPTQVHELSVADASHAHGAEHPTLTQVHSLIVQDVTHSHPVETPAPTQQHVLTVHDATHAHQADAPSLVQNSTLEVQDATHGHSVDGPALIQTHVLQVQDAGHAHSSDAPELAQRHLLTVADALHEHPVDSPTIARATELRVRRGSREPERGATSVAGQRIHGTREPAMTGASVRASTAMSKEPDSSAVTSEDAS